MKFSILQSVIFVLFIYSYGISQESVDSSKNIADYRSSANLCQVHLVQLTEDTVSIAYGLIDFPLAYTKARRELFPNSKKYFLGGCIVFSESPKAARVSICEQCRIAEAGWKEPEKEIDELIVPVNELIEKPVVLLSIKPKMPELPSKGRAEGDVTVYVLVDTLGNVEEAKVAYSTFAFLNKSALEAAKYFRFKPAKSANGLAKCWVRIPFSFR